MADEQQLAILKQGVKAWNEWRSRNLSASKEDALTFASSAESVGNLAGFSEAID
jgi:hypothetical protein